MYINEPHASRLVVADQKAGVLYAVDPSSGVVVREDTDTVLAEHAGFLTLPGGRLAYVDDAAGELVVLDVFTSASNWREGVVSVAIPGEHLAASSDGRFVAVTTGLGLAFEPWSDLITVVDRQATRRRSRRVRTRRGEPGVIIARDLRDPHTSSALVIRHREPGALEIITVEAMHAADAHGPVLRGELTELPDDGHGDAYDPATGMIFTATHVGVHRHTLEDGVLAAHEILSWNAPGRAYFLRFCPRDRTVFAVVRGGDPDPKNWHTWTNFLWRYALDTHEISTIPIGVGLVFRLALTQHHAVVTRIAPNGDEAISFRRNPASTLQEEGRSMLPSMRNAPAPGREPWDRVERRAIAASPAGSLFAVTRGGHGEVHILNAAQPCAPGRTIQLPSPLHDGGHLAWLVRGDGDTFGHDLVGR
ncbi:hypothetical protein [Cryobacterium sp. PH31-O1]|uniref:hypothetical protein n=1 Tax=Cryobacterium sp. PH31-O1 TaxID=3046306 RepID=UPI0024BB9ACA|nr:hypothetical protein [Cryobacterium sp. PH31-O1]MDJ0338723.1 hypothetical protein [Cryobacterium sp. PH31-O1]